jgi:hypothetical protein
MAASDALFLIASWLTAGKWIKPEDGSATQNPDEEGPMESGWLRPAVTLMLGVSLLLIVAAELNI